MRAGDQIFTLEPRDVLLVRDGRAMNANVGRSLPFPPPSTLAGVVRTRLGLDTQGRFEAARAKELREQVSVIGPLLAHLSPDGERVLDVLAPAPADCVWFPDEGGAPAGRRLVPCRTASIAPGASTDLGPDAELVDFADLAPAEKPVEGPAFWSWASLLGWLERPRDALALAEIEGVRAFPRELRTHVAVDPATGTAEEGALFAIEGVRFTRVRSSTPAEGRPARTLDRFAVLGAWHGPGKLSRGMVPLGGERVAALLEVREAGAGPSLGPPGWLDALQPATRARVVLLTPALFKEGSSPAFVMGARVVASKVDRAEVISGWNFETNRPKPTRRAVPAGSVFWVEVPSNGWARDAWLTAVSDGEQDRRDGFGLAVVGVA